VRTSLIITAAVLALALPSAALAQDGYGPGGGVLGEQNSGGGPTGTSGGGGGGEKPGATAPAASVERGAQANGSGGLPFTGLDLLVIAGIGMALVGAGVGLRRLRDNP
jgi:hypothetical protein